MSTHLVIGAGPVGSEVARLLARDGHDVVVVTRHGSGSNLAGVRLVAADAASVDALLKTKHDQPTIGILICKSKNDTVVEYTLRDMHKPMGVSEYTLVEALPDNLKGAMPTVEEIENDLLQLQQQEADDE